MAIKAAPENTVASHSERLKLRRRQSYIKHLLYSIQTNFAVHRQNEGCVSTRGCCHRFPVGVGRSAFSSSDHFLRWTGGNPRWSFDCVASQCASSRLHCRWRVGRIDPELIASEYPGGRNTSMQRHPEFQLHRCIPAVDQHFGYTAVLVGHSSAAGGSWASNQPYCFIGTVNIVNAATNSTARLIGYDLCDMWKTLICLKT